MNANFENGGELSLTLLDIFQENNLRGIQSTLWDFSASLHQAGWAIFIVVQQAQNYITNGPTVNFIQAGHRAEGSYHWSNIQVEWFGIDLHNRFNGMSGLHLYDHEG